MSISQLGNRKLMVTLSSDGDILVNNCHVGRLIYEENHIKKVEVDTAEQNQGYATAAIEQYLERMASEGYGQVTTSPATTPAIQHIFKKLGFRRVEDPSQHDFLQGDVEERYRACFVKELSCD